MPPLEYDTKWLGLEDNDAVIELLVKTRAPTMRHVARTHRIDLDWFIERCRDDQSIKIRFVCTKEQIADVLTKGAFTAAQLHILCKLAQVGEGGSKLMTHKQSSDNTITTWIKTYTESATQTKAETPKKTISHLLTA